RVSCERGCAQIVQASTRCRNQHSPRTVILAHRRLPEFHPDQLRSSVECVDPTSGRCIRADGEKANGWVNVRRVSSVAFQLAIICLYTTCLRAISSAKTEKD